MDNEYEMVVPVELRAKVLAALYNNARPLGMGFVAAIGAKREWTEEDAAKEISDYQERASAHKHQAPQASDDYYCDYLEGRPIKVSFKGDRIQGLHLYNRDQGRGAAQWIISEIVTSPASAA